MTNPPTSPTHQPIKPRPFFLSLPGLRQARASSRQQGTRGGPQQSSSTSALLSKSLIVDKCWGDYCAPPLNDVGKAANGIETKDAAVGHR